MYQNKKNGLQKVRLSTGLTQEALAERLVFEEIMETAGRANKVYYEMRFAAGERL